MAEFESYFVSLLQAAAKTAAARGGRANPWQTEGTVKMHGFIREPDVLDWDPDYKPTEQGLVTADQQYPQTEGYQPKQGYFSQSPECDRIMRQWFDLCAFADAPGSYYFKGAAKLFPPGDGTLKGKFKSGNFNTANFIGNVLKNRQPIQQMYNSLHKR
jgi:hypothetical protein